MARVVLGLALSYLFPLFVLLFNQKTQALFLLTLKLYKKIQEMWLSNFSRLAMAVLVASCIGRTAYAAAHGQLDQRGTAGCNAPADTEARAVPQRVQGLCDLDLAEAARNAALQQKYEALDRAAAEGELTQSRQRSGERQALA